MKELPNPTFALSPVHLPRGSLHPVSQQDLAPGQNKMGIVVSWAQHEDEVREAQRLRYEVFAGEMGARLTTVLPGHDIDLFDDYCEHLLVRDALRDRDSARFMAGHNSTTPAYVFSLTDH